MEPAEAGASAPAPDAWNGIEQRDELTDIVPIPAGQ